jgi:hypothetical protein
MVRWNEMVPRITSVSLPSQMLSIKNKLMPIGDDICRSSTNNMEHDAEHDQVDGDTSSSKAKRSSQAQSDGPAKSP